LALAPATLPYLIDQADEEQDEGDAARNEDLVHLPPADGTFERSIQGVEDGHHQRDQGDDRRARQEPKVGLQTSLEFQVPGVGQKMAARLVLELKGKLAGRAASAVPTARDDEVVAALVGLGYTQAEAQAAAASVPSDGSISVEERLRHALAYFGRRA
jgi:hypothetical protein